jgi:hypothetical protein
MAVGFLQRRGFPDYLMCSFLDKETLSLIFYVL